LSLPGPPRHDSPPHRSRPPQRLRPLAHIGVIDALTEAGIESDIVCGTSMGALVGAAYVTDGLEPLRQ
jgi:hypothetical protein